MAFSAMSTFWQLNTLTPSYINGTGGAYKVYTYNGYTILVVTAGTVIVNPPKNLICGYLVVGPGGRGALGVSGAFGGSGGVVKIGTIVSHSITITAYTPATLFIGTGSGSSSISGTTSNITSGPGLNGSIALTSGLYNGVAVTYGNGGNSVNSTIGCLGGTGFNFVTHSIPEISLNTDYVGGGGGGWKFDNTGDTATYAGSGGPGGGGGGSSGASGVYGGGGIGTVNFATSSVFGNNGQAGTISKGGNGGANTGGGGGAGRGSTQSSGGSGVILIYYTTPTF